MTPELKYFPSVPRRMRLMSLASSVFPVWAAAAKVLPWQSRSQRGVTGLMMRMSGSR